jgi:hypothetical protein
LVPIRRKSFARKKVFAIIRQDEIRHIARRTPTAPAVTPATGLLATGLRVSG